MRTLPWRRPWLELHQGNSALHYEAPELHANQLDHSWHNTTDPPNRLQSLGTMGTFTNITASPTAQAVALITLTSALAISFSLQQSKKQIMPANDKAAAAAAADPPELPNSRYVVGSFQNSRSQSLFTINLPPKDTSSPPKAMLFVVHGVAEHCIRGGYLSLYESLSESGVDVYSFDQHGHGRSEGEPRGYADKFDHYVSDLLDYIQQCQQKYKDSGKEVPPLVLMGQSMGALVSVMAVLRLGSYHVAGLILTSPALGVDMNLELKVQKAFAPLINKWMPKANIVDGVRPKDMSRNLEAVQAYIDDPLVQKGKLIARTAIEMDKSFTVAKERRGEITCPLLILHGTDDKCTSINASRDFFKSVGTGVERKRFLQLPGLYHELLEEPEVDELMVCIVGFASSGGKEFVQMKGDETDGLISVEFR